MLVQSTRTLPNEPPPPPAGASLRAASPSCRACRRGGGAAVFFTARGTVVGVAFRGWSAADPRRVRTFFRRRRRGSAAAAARRRLGSRGEPVVPGVPSRRRRGRVFYRPRHRSRCRSSWLVSAPTQGVCGPFLGVGAAVPPPTPPAGASVRAASPPCRACRRGGGAAGFYPPEARSRRRFAPRLVGRRPKARADFFRCWRRGSAAAAAPPVPRFARRARRAGRAVAAAVRPGFTARGVVLHSLSPARLGRIKAVPDSALPRRCAARSPSALRVARHGCVMCCRVAPAVLCLSCPMRPRDVSLCVRVPIESERARVIS